MQESTKGDASGQLSAPGLLTNLDKSWPRVYCACSRYMYGSWLFGYFSLNYLGLTEENTVSKRRKLTTTN